MCDTQNLMNENVSICMNNWNANNKIRGSTNCSWLVTRVSIASFPFHAISFFGENVLAKSAKNIVPLLLMEIVLKMEFNLLFTHLFMALSKEIVNGTDAHRQRHHYNCAYVCLLHRLFVHIFSLPLFRCVSRFFCMNLAI